MTKEKKTIASVHRFRDTVALYVGTGETVYLTLDQATELEKMISGCANDITKNKFVDSEFNTSKIEV